MAHVSAQNKHKAPKNAVVVTALLVVVVMLIGEIDLLAPLVTGLFLLTFVVINLTCFLFCISESDQFKPELQPFYF